MHLLEQIDEYQLLNTFEAPHTYSWFMVVPVSRMPWADITMKPKIALEAMSRMEYAQTSKETEKDAKPSEKSQTTLR